MEDTLQKVEEHTMPEPVKLIPRRLLLSIYKFPLVAATFRRVLNLLVPKQRRVVTIASGAAKGLKMELRLREEKSYWLGTYELDIQCLLPEMIQSGNIVYDVGAHLGFFSLLAGKLVGQTGKVFAFEPNPENLNRLATNIGLNSINWINFVPKALSDHSGEMTFSVSNSSMGQLVELETPTMRTYRVTTTTLDELVFEEQYPVPDFIKIDVEGEEGKVLVGGRKLLKEFKPVIICELHGAEAASQVKAELFKVGYRLEKLDGEQLFSLPPYGHLLAQSKASIP